MGKIITIKNNKGGVGKSWLTLQLAHILSNIAENKVLVLTSDSQNNVMLYAGIDIEFTKGLEHWLDKGDGDMIALRNNLYYIPLNSSNFKRGFDKKLKVLMEKLKTEYDYILIDSVPILNIDKCFLELADSIVIPTMLDTASCKGILNLSNEVDLSKVKAIVPNKFSKTKAEKFWKNILGDFLKGNSIYFAEPIPQMAFLAELTHQGKTILESSSKKIDDVQNNLIELAKVVC
ncbi:MAG: ParA family protein [Cetobacterium sp.]